MTYFTWDPAYDTGIPGIDHEHRQLVRMLNDIQEMITKHAEPICVAERLAEFCTLATAHFALEEKIMQDQKHPVLEERKDIHYRLLDQVREIMDTYETGSLESRESLPATLKEWLLEAMEIDTKLFAELGNVKLRAWGLRRD